MALSTGNLLNRILIKKSYSVWGNNFLVQFIVAADTAPVIWAKRV